MLKKTLFIIFLILFLLDAKAIEWVSLTSQTGKSVSVDKDSITDVNGYYFYNIKVINEHTSKESIITVQASKKSTNAARIQSYTPQEYTNLNGDYKNITKNMTESLEPTNFYSTVNTCSRWVKKQKLQNFSGIIIQNE